uniref:AlNc14C95G5825 protein n=1 Tax=Albugo laibachii Nc14 TaxID=890382 RepID=F0WGU9_9STRA|nr:AlNc14C95G5825 [Albugo laibachii Nc14]|eukprot:CCA20464.1 AlNc14C95G5825 [Albugo laibachii Nc14]
MYSKSQTSRYSTRQDTNLHCEQANFCGLLYALNIPYPAFLVEVRIDSQRHSIRSLIDVARKSEARSKIARKLRLLS